MLILVRIIGVLIGCMGLSVCVFPKLMKTMLAFWREGKRIYGASIARLVLGSIFLLASFRARNPLGMFILGALTFLGGMLIPILGLDRIKAMLDWWDEKPLLFFRLAGLLACTVGVLLIYFA